MCVCVLPPHQSITAPSTTHWNWPTTPASYTHYSVRASEWQRNSRLNRCKPRSEDNVTMWLTPLSSHLFLHCKLTSFLRLTVNIRAQTRLLPFLLTINSNLAGTSESRLMLIRSSPASFSLGRSRAKFMPLVVTAMVFRPSSFLSSAAEGDEHGNQRETDVCEAFPQELFASTTIQVSVAEVENPSVVRDAKTAAGYKQDRVWTCFSTWVLYIYNLILVSLWLYPHKLMTVFSKSVRFFFFSHMEESQ